MERPQWGNIRGRVEVSIGREHGGLRAEVSPRLRLVEGAGLKTSTSHRPSCDRVFRRLLALPNAAVEGSEWTTQVRERLFKRFMKII